MYPFREHIKYCSPVMKRLHDFSLNVTEENIEILASTSKGERYLMTLEALWIRELVPGIET